MAQVPANLPPSLQLLLQKQQRAESTNVMADGGKGAYLVSVLAAQD